MRETSVAWVETMTAASRVSVARASTLLQRCSTGDAAGRWRVTAGSYRPSSVPNVRSEWLWESRPIKPVCVLGRKSRIQWTINDCSNKTPMKATPPLKKYVLKGGIKVTMEPSSNRFHVVLHHLLSNMLIFAPSATQTWRDHAPSPPYHHHIV